MCEGLLCGVYLLLRPERIRLLRARREEEKVLWLWETIPKLKTRKSRYAYHADASDSGCLGCPSSSLWTPLYRMWEPTSLTSVNRDLDLRTHYYTEHFSFASFFIEMTKICVLCIYNVFKYICVYTRKIYVDVCCSYIINMFVYMYVCMYVCIYVCMYVCIYACI